MNNNTMKKHTHTLLAAMAAAALVLGAFFNTGCQALTDFKEDNPVVWEIGKGAAEIALTRYLVGAEESFVADNREALLKATNRVLAQNDDPRIVADELTREINGIFPDEPQTRDVLLRTLSGVLRPNPNVPASGPATEYKSALADALSPAAPSSAQRSKPVDLSLYGWLTSADNRAATRAYYNPPTQSEIDQARKLEALAAATGEDGSVDHATYRRLSQ